jgi:hypothetical protein
MQLGGIQTVNGYGHAAPLYLRARALGVWWWWWWGHLARGRAQTDANGAPAGPTPPPHEKQRAQRPGLLG